MAGQPATPAVVLLLVGAPATPAHLLLLAADFSEPSSEGLTDPDAEAAAGADAEADATADMEAAAAAADAGDCWWASAVAEDVGTLMTREPMPF